MRYWILTVVAAALIGGGIFTAALSIKEVADIGSCGGGQVVINDRYSNEPCPEGTGTLIGLSVGGIFASIAGVFGFILRGRRPGQRARRGGAGPALVSGAGGPSGAGPTTPPQPPAYTPPQPKPPPRGPAPPTPAPPTSQPTPPAPSLPTMPSVPPVPGYSAPPPSAAAADEGDPVERLAKLDKLREQGVLSEAEFAAAKARILGDL